MLKLIKNNKFTVVLLAVLMLVCIQKIFYLIPVYPLMYQLSEYIEIRHNYKEYRQLAEPFRGISVYGKGGYITKVYFHNLNYIQEGDFAIINSLPRLQILRIKTYKYEDDRKLICTQMALLDKVDNKNLTEMQYDFEEEPRVDCLYVPRSVTTLRVRGLNVNNDDLMELAKFDQVKEILIYCIGNDGRNVTSTGVKAFNEIRPDVKVWWNGNINMGRKSRDFCYYDFEDFYDSD